MLASHAVTRTQFADLAAGHGGPEAIRTLWRGQADKRVMIMGAVARAVGEIGDAPGSPLGLIRTAAGLDPETVRSVLVQPMVGAWAASALRALKKGESPDFAHLGAIALVVALRTGMSAEASVAARNGWVHLPGRGRVRIDASHARIDARTERGRLWLDGVEITPHGERWQWLRTLHADGPPYVAPTVEDLDPSRDLYHVPAAERLSLPEFHEWQERFARGWHVLVHRVREHADEIAEGLAAIVPLSKPDVRAARSATHPDAVGVIGLDRPGGAADLAITLVHEFQHSKLQALHDIHALHRPSDERYFAPWRTDPRPLGGFLQGTYAFLGVADAWRSLCADPAAFPQAELRFAETRAFVTDAVGRLAGAAALTGAGREFVAGMTRAIKRLHDVPVRATTVAAADRTLAGIRGEWRRLNRRPVG
jgi:uncharacterized protein